MLNANSGREIVFLLCTPRGIYSKFATEFNVNGVLQGIFFAALEKVSTSLTKYISPKLTMRIFYITEPCKYAGHSVMKSVYENTDV
jgi:hypothetical protein